MAYPGQGYGPGGGGGWHNQGPPQQHWGPPQQQGYGYNQGPPQHHYPPQQGYGHPPPPQNQYNQYQQQQPQQYYHGGYAPREHAQHLPLPPQGAQQFGHGAPQGYTFQYSNCNGKRKALLIGINYFGKKGALKGCINDTRNLSNFLQENFGYKEEDMVILTDDQQNRILQPNRKNILKAMNWLVSNAQPNDSLFLHYSGHGGQTEDLDGDEGDGFDEVIYPCDWQTEGHIVDDEVHAIVVKPLSPGVRLTAIFDSCHSGSMMDLPYIYSTKGVLKEPNLAKEAGQGLLSAVMSYARGDLGGVASSFMSFAKSAMTGDKAHEQTIRTKTSPADVILWSGSKDDQTSADATIASQATGAMSWAFISALKEKPEQTYLELLNNIRDKLETKYTQKPQLSCSHPLDVDLDFIM